MMMSAISLKAYIIDNSLSNKTDELIFKTHILRRKNASLVDFGYNGSELGGLEHSVTSSKQQNAPNARLNRDFGDFLLLKAKRCHKELMYQVSSLWR